MSLVGGLLGGEVGGLLGGLSTPTPPPTYPTYVAPLYCTVQRGGLQATVVAPQIAPPYRSQVQVVPQMRGLVVDIQYGGYSAIVEVQEAGQ